MDCWEWRGAKSVLELIRKRTQNGNMFYAGVQGINAWGL